MDEIPKMKSSQPPSIPRSASEAELLKHVGSESNLVDLAAESDSLDKNGATRDEILTSVQDLQDQGTNSQREAGEEKKVLSYGSYCAQCPNSSKKQRVEAIQAFYNSLQSA